MLDGDQPGSCGTTEFDEGDCSHGFSGAWDAATLRLRTLDDCVQHCVARCARCRWVSFRPLHDCSWYHSCDEPGQLRYHGDKFVSQQVLRSGLGPYHKS